MESFMLYFSAAGMVVGAIMLLFGIGLIIWGLWPRRPAESSQQEYRTATAPPSQSEAAQQ